MKLACPDKNLLQEGPTGGFVDPRYGMTPAASDNHALPGHVLIVEDDPLITLDVEDNIRGMGVSLVRTASNVARALELIAELPPDFALLDVGLRQENSFGIATRLAAMKIPFAFVTGYSAKESIPAEFADYPRLAKPYTAGALTTLLKDAWASKR